MTTDQPNAGQSKATDQSKATGQLSTGPSSTTASAIVLELRNLRLTHDSARPALFGGLNLSLEKGQFVLLQGPSGCGKTSLLRCLAGLEARAEANLRFAGDGILATEIPGFRNQVIYVPQTPPRWSLTAEESLMAAFDFQSQQRKYDSEQAEQYCLELLLQPEILKLDLNQLSGGEGKRLALIRALLLQPVVLLLDEPANGLDPDAQTAMADVLRTWCKEDTHTVVCCTHQSDWCQALVKRTWTLKRGGFLTEETSSP